MARFLSLHQLLTRNKIESTGQIIMVTVIERIMSQWFGEVRWYYIRTDRYIL